jgi:hypothetical protein
MTGLVMLGPPKLSTVFSLISSLLQKNKNTKNNYAIGSVADPGCFIPDPRYKHFIIQNPGSEHFFIPDPGSYMQSGMQT